MSKRMPTELRREQIAEAGLTLAARGMEAVTVTAVAEAVGVAPSALYRHFRNKDAILDAMLDLMGRRLRENVAASLAEAPDNALEALRLLLLRHVALITRHPAMPRLLFSDEIYQRLPDKRAKLLAHMLAFREAVASLARRGQEAGVVRPDADPVDLAMLFLGLMAPGAILFHMSDGTFDLKAQAERNWPFFAEAVRPHGPHPHGGHSHD